MVGSLTRPDNDRLRTRIAEAVAMLRFHDTLDPVDRLELAGILRIVANKEELLARSDGRGHGPNPSRSR